jgi:hypothetical protein
LQVEGGLIEQEQLLSLERIGQVHLEREPIVGGRLHARLEHHVTVPARPLGLVEGNVGVPQQLVARSTLAHRDTDAGGYRQLPPGLDGDVVGLAQDLQEAFRDELGAGVERGALQQGNELVATQAGCCIALSDEGCQSRGDQPQELIAGGVPELVVYVLKAVEVHVQRSRRPRLAPGASEHLLSAVESQDAIR